MYTQSLIKQGQSLKNDSNEHITSKCSSGHVKRSNHLWLLACLTHKQCEIQEVFASRIQDPTRAQVCSTQDNATKSKSTKKMLQSKDINESTEYKLKVLNQST